MYLLRARYDCCLLTVGGLIPHDKASSLDSHVRSRGRLDSANAGIGIFLHLMHTQRKPSESSRYHIAEKGRAGCAAIFTRMQNLARTIGGRASRALPSKSIAARVQTRTTADRGGTAKQNKAGGPAGRSSPARAVTGMGKSTTRTFSAPLVVILDDMPSCLPRHIDRCGGGGGGAKTHNPQRTPPLQKPTRGKKRTLDGDPADEAFTVSNRGLEAPAGMTSIQYFPEKDVTVSTT